MHEPDRDVFHNIDHQNQGRYDTVKDNLYLALGDSIATGTLHNFARVTSYTGYLYQTLRKRGYQTRMMSLAQDGDTTRELLYKLGQNWFQGWVRHADLITLSIGGNNLMRAASIPGFTSVCVPKAEAGVCAFCSDWEKIIERLRVLNPHCSLIIMTVYNPYNHTQNLSSGYRADSGLWGLTERYLRKINGVIESQCRGRYEIADIHKLFDRFSHGGMGWVASLYSSGLYILRNPHPTSYGHRLISCAHAEVIEKQLESRPEL